MATLKSLYGRSTTVDRRGQLLLIGAFGIAVILLAFAGVLNTITYTENVAVQDDDHPASRDIAAINDDVQRGIAGILSRVNDNSSDFTTKKQQLTQSVRNWTEGVNREYAHDITGITVTVADTTVGSRITQSSTRSLTNASGAANWTLARDVSDTRQFELGLNDDALVAGSCSSNACYTLVADDGTAQWNLSVNESAVVIAGPSGDGSCTIDSDSVKIDLINGTVNDRSCQPLTFAEGLNSSYAIRYHNGENAEGTYQLEASRADIDNGDFATDGSPSASPIIYATSIEVTVRTPRLTASGVMRIPNGDNHV